MNPQRPVLQTFNFNSTTVSLLLYDSPCDDQNPNSSFLALDVQARVPSKGVVGNDTEKLQQRLRDLQTAREAIDKACSEVESSIERAIQGGSSQCQQANNQGPQPTQAYPAFSPITASRSSSPSEQLPWDQVPPEPWDDMAAGPTCSSVCSSKRRRWSLPPKQTRGPPSQPKWATRGMMPSFAAGSRTSGPPSQFGSTQQRRQPSGARTQSARTPMEWDSRRGGGVSTTYSDMSAGTTQGCRPQRTSGLGGASGMSTRHAAGMPTRNVAGMPTRHSAGMPTRNAAGMPTRNVTGMPTRNIAGMPTRNVVGMSTRNVAGMSTRNVTGMSTRKAPVATSCRRRTLAASSTSSLNDPSNRTIQDLVGKFNNLEDIAFDEVTSHGHQKEALNLSVSALNEGAD